MMMLKSVCIVYIIVFANLITQSTQENIDGFDVNENKNGTTDTVVLKDKDGSSTTEVTNTAKNYTVFLNGDTHCYVFFGGEIEYNTCYDTYEPLDANVSQGIRDDCQGRTVLYISGECQNETGRRKRSYYCVRWKIYYRTYCSIGRSCVRCVRYFYLRRCFRRIGK